MPSSIQSKVQNIVSDRLQKMLQQEVPSSRQQSNLYQHLCEVINKLPINQPSINPLKQLGIISQNIKKSKQRELKKQPLNQQQLKTHIQNQILYPQWLIHKNQLISEVKNIQSTNRIVQNFQKTNQLFTNVGINFGRQQAYRITMQLKKLAHKVHAKKIRFWGKILTKSADYYVIQGVAIKKNPQKILQGMEKYGQGVNYYSYWVNNTAMSNQWHQLPLITPQHIRTSRLIKYTFSGNLNNVIKSYPVFSGRQQHLLKAQLVRLTHNCQIIPKGQFTAIQQNADQIQFSQQFKHPQFVQQSNPQSWQHLNPYILQLGRNTYWTDPTLTQQQKQEQISKMNQTDPKMERLKGINQDKPVDGMGVETAWNVRVVGSNQLFNNTGKDEGTTSCYAVVVLKNVNWPGWYTVSNMNMYDSVYIGYGIKATQPAFFPSGPENLMLEGQDADEFPEPNPTNPPDELEPDSDDEGKKPQQ